MRLKESIIIILLLFILIGGVNAADNQTDDLTVSDNDIVAVDVTPVDESTDSSGIKTVEQNISNVAKATSNGEILSASAQNDVLGGTLADFKSKFPTSPNTNSITLDQDYSSGSFGYDTEPKTKASSIIGAKSDGSKVVITGYDKTRLLTIVEGANTTVKNVKFVSSNPSNLAYGGAILIGKNSVVTFENCDFESNSAKNSGGAIYITQGSTVTFINCKFNGNSLSNSGNDNGGGAIFTPGANIIVDNCTFDGNGGTINNGCGGFIRAAASSADNIISSISIKNSKFENMGAYRAGALYISDCVDLLISNSSFKDNTASNQGASAYLVTAHSSRSNVDISYSNFTGNKVTGGMGNLLLGSNIEAVIDHCSFENNVASGAGAGVAAGNGVKKLTVKNSIFNHNSAGTTSGSIYYGATQGYLKVYNTAFSYNTAATNGGAIYAASGRDNIEISYSNFTNNSANLGGALEFQGGMKNFTIDHANFINNTASSNGGALYINAYSENILIKNSLFTNNSAKSGGAIDFYSTTDQNPYNNIDILNSNFTNNKATDTMDARGGSAIRFINVKDVDFEKCNFDKNGATVYGALYFSDFNDVSFAQCNFTNNSAKSGAAIYYGGSTKTTAAYSDSKFINNSAIEYGGAIYIAGNNQKFENTVFENNKLTSPSRGGAVYMHSGVENILFDKCNFTNNTLKVPAADSTTAVQGGAIYSQATNVTVRESNFINNYAVRHGGAIIQSADDWNGNSKFNVVKSTFINNTAHNGGALDIYHTSDVNVTDCKFENNTATGSGGEGGALWMDSFQGKISGCNFTNNTAGIGSAIAYIPASVASIGATKATMVNNNFIRNKATDSATVRFDSIQGTIDNCNFTDNIAQTAAGLYVNIDGVSITNTDFTNNTASGDAGAIYFTNAATGSSVDNCNFTNNTANNGGAIVVDANQITIKNSRFINNTASKGGAIYYGNTQNGVIENVIFKNNTANDGGAVYVSKYPGSTVSPVQIKTSEFINNTAKYNGGAALIYIGENRYRDYDNFTGLGTVTKGSADGRLTWTVSGNNIIYDSLFENNIDYFFNVSTSVSDAIATITITVPSYADKSSAKVRVKFVDANNNETTYTYIPDDPTLWVWEGNTVRLTATLPDGSYNATVSFEDDNCMLKSISDNRTNFTVHAVTGEFTKLQKYINDWIEAGNTTIILNQTLVPYQVDLGDNGPIIINSPVNLISTTDTVIDAKGFCRIFIVNASNVNITGITFINGNAGGPNSTDDGHNGGAILWKGTGGSVTDCIFENNTAVNGGAVFVQNTGINGKIINSTFLKNNATLNGGAVDWNATGGNVTGSKFIGNNATYGGAIYVGSNSTHSYLSNSNFTNNKASERGGAVDWFASSGDIENARFEENSARYGGAVFVGKQSGKGNITGSTFIKNTAEVNGGAVDWNATGGNIKDSKFYSNTANLGGAVYVGANGTSGNITGSVFEDNKAQERGGAVDWYASSGNIINSNFTRNEAKYGGAVFVGHKTNGGNITGSRFIDNTAGENGGAVDWNASRGNLSNSVFEKNSAKYGGAVFVGSNATNGTIYNSVFTNNSASVNGGAVDWNASSGKVNSSYFYNNTAGKNGGAVFVGFNSTNGHIYNSVFTGNNATDGRGGAVDWYASSGDIENSNFTSNRAQYGGAVFVGHATDGGNITNSRFINNTATVNGGAVDWNATGGEVNGSVFTGNKAANGGAIFVGSKSTNGKIYNSTFNNNTASLKGGAVDWNASSGNISSSRFNGNKAEYGGAVFVGSKTTESYIINSNFTENSATRGGAVDWNASEGDIVGSRFISNSAVDGGAVYIGSGAPSGNITDSYFKDNTASNNGGAVYFNNVADADLLNDEFISNTALNGGAVYAHDASNGLINESKFTSNSADVGAAVYIENSDKFNITNTEFTTNDAQKASDIFISESKGNLFNNLTVNANSNVNSIFVDANITVNDSTVNNVNIIFNSDTSTLSNTKLIGENPIIISSDATVYLTKNNNTENDGNYSVFNNGTLYLSKNNFTNVIINNGTIKTQTTTIVLNNLTVIIEKGESIILNATIVDDNNNTIVSAKQLDFTLNSANNLPSEYEGKYHYATYDSVKGVYIVSLTQTGLEDNTIKTGTLKVKENTQMNLTVDSQVNQGEKVVIKAQLMESATGNVTFYVNGVKQDEDIVLVNGVAYLTLNNLTASYYTVNAVYNGDDTHFTSENETSFNVELRKTIMNITVYNILTNQTEVLTVNINANGTVIVYVNSKRNELEIKNGKAVWDITGLTEGEYSVEAIYVGNSYYESQTNVSQFNVSDFSVSVEDTQYNESAVIKINMPENSDADDFTVYVNGVEVTNKTVVDGVLIATTDRLTTLGEYEVNVTYNGDKYPAKDINGTKFSVEKATDYTLNADVKPADKYGDNTTITVTAPVGITKVNVTIDGKTQELELTDGKGELNVSDLSAGDHTVTVSYAGDDNYNAKENTTSISIPQATPELEITYTELKPGQTTVITVNVGENATGDIVITVNGVDKLVKVNDGVATLETGVLEPGEFNVTVSYYGDKNYTAASNSKNTTVPKYGTETTVTTAVNDDNSINVTISVNATDASGKVTINGTEYEPVFNNGVATVVLPSQGINNDFTFTVTYNGNDKYAESTGTATAHTELLNNATIELDATVRQHGDNTTLTITVPEDADGTVTVYINGTPVKTIPNVSGTIQVNVTPDVGLNEINVTLTQSSKYNPVNATKNITIESQDTYTFDVDVTNGKYGENSTIKVTVPCELAETVTLTIDGKEYTINVNTTTGVGVLNVSGLSAGNHDVKVTAGNKNYTAQTVNKTLTVGQATPTLTLESNGNTPGENVTLTVHVGENATGKVIITVDGTPKVVNVDKNGNAVLNITNAQPGNHTVSAEYLGDNNYTETAETYLGNFTVDLFKVEIKDVEIVLNDDNTANVTITFNETDVTGTVTVKTDKEEFTVDIVDGKVETTLKALGYNETVKVNVTYNGNSKYNTTNKTSSVTLPLLSNATVDIQVQPAEHGDNTTLIITVPEDAGGVISVYINNELVNVTPNTNGKLVLNVTPDVGYNDIKVTLTDSNKYKDAEGTANVTIETQSDYTFNVEVEGKDYGENSTITVTVLGELAGTVTLTIDGKEYTINVNTTTGVGVLNVSGLSAGDHEVKVTAGNENYTAKTNTSILTIGKATPDIIKSVEGTTPGKTSTVTVNIGENATGKAIVNVNGTPQTVDVNNGIAVFEITNAQPGNYSITVEYLGDANYTAKTADLGNVTIDKFNSTIENVEVVFNDDNSAVVTVKVNESDATGTVTVKIGEEEFTGTVENGVATVDVTPREPGKQLVFDINYSGNNRYYGNTSSTTEKIPLLKNATIDLTVVPAKHGENTTITITVPADVDGNISVYVNGTLVNITPNTGGVIVLNVTPDVGPNEIKVTLTNSTKYADMKATENINITSQDTYTFDVEVTPREYGENSTITVTVPAELAETVTLTIDGKEYTINVNTTTGVGVLNVSGLSAGSHEVNVTAGNENYTAQTVTEKLEIPQATTELTHEVKGNTPGENVTVTVHIGENATGKVIITVDGTPTVVDVDENGNAVLNITNAQPGNHTLKAEYLGDNNYTSDIKTFDNFTVDLFKVEIKDVKIDLNNDNSANVTVTFNESDVGGTVTITAGDQEITVPVVNGVATANLESLGFNKTVPVTVTFNADDKRYNATSATKPVVLPLLTNATIEVDIKEGQHGDNTTITIKVPADADGNVTVYVNGTPISVTPDENGTVVLNVTPGVGPNEIKVTLTNSSKYNDTEIIKDVNITSQDTYTFDVEVVPGKYGENSTITVTVPGELAETVTLTIDGKEYTINVNSTTGVGVLNVSGLSAGDHEVKVTAGNENYTAKTNNSTLTIDKATPDLTKSVEGSTPGKTSTVTINVGENATGFVIVTVDGTPQTVEVIDGIAVFEITDAQPGNHSITARYLGDDNYTATGVMDLGNVSIDKFNSTIKNVEIELNPDNSAVVTITVNESDATGPVTVKVGEETFTGTVEKGVAKVEVTPLGYGKNVTFEVTYDGDGKYNGNNTSVDKELPLLTNATIELTVEPAKYGDNTTITIKVPVDAGGNVTVYVNGTPKVVTPDENGNIVLNVTPDVGPNEIIVKLTNSTKYADFSNSTEITVESQDDYTFNVEVTPAEYGENATIKVTVSDEVKDTVVIKIDGKQYTPVEDAEGNLIVNVSGINAGEHEIEVTVGNENYTEKSFTDTLTIDQTTPELTSNVTGSAAGEDVTVTINVGENATGKVIITIDGTPHLVDVDENGTASFTVPNAQPGNHTVTAQYLGDNNYTATEVTDLGNFTVGLFDVEIENITVDLNPDNSANITVKFNESDVGGTVTITDGNQTVTVPVKDGIATANLESLGFNKTADIKVTFNADDKRYNATSATKSVDLPLLTNVTIEVDIKEGQHGDNTTITIKVPVDADGNVTVYVNGTPISVTPDENGTVVLNVTPGVGPNEIKVTLTNSSKYNDTEIIKDVNITSQDNYTFDVEVTPGQYGENSTIKVTVPGELKDNVTVTIDGVEYPIIIDENGTGVLNVSGLSAGDHEIVVKTGNENYTGKTNVTTLTIPQTTPELTSNVTGSAAGEDVTVTINVGENATGKVIITIDGTPHLVDVDENGTASFTVPNAQPGNHTVTAQYLGDNNYTATEVTDLGNFTVGLFDVEIENITVDLNPDNSANITVKFNESDVGGTVTITDGNQTVTVPVKDGIATANLESLGFNKTADIKVTFNADDKRYNATSATKSVDLPLLTNVTIEVDIKEGQHGDNTTITIKVPVDADGNVTVYVNGTPISVTPDENGTVVLNVTPGVGPNEIKVTLTNSSKYNDTEITKEVNITSQDNYTFDVEVIPAKYGENSTIKVTVPDELKDTVVITVDGVPYETTIDEDGNVIVNVTGISAGDHEIVVTAGNENYTGKTNVTTLTIPQTTPELTSNVTGSAAGEDVTVTINVGENATGKVIITIDDIPHVVDVDENGTASFTVPNAQPGNHTVTAEYLGDGNYTATGVIPLDDFTVGLFDVEIENVTVDLNPDNSANVTVKFNESDVGGTVTITAGDQEITVPVVNGVATANLEALGFNKTVPVTVTFNADDKRYNATSKVEKVDLPLLTNATIEVGIEEGQHGDNTTITIKVPVDADGNVTVYVNGTPISVTPDENGTVVLNVTPGVGPNEIKVTLTNSSKYNDTEIIKDVNITSQDNYTFDVEVTPGQYGENSTIKVTVPGELKDNVTVTIDGVEYPIVIDENGTGVLNVSGLSAGDHEIIVKTGNENYTGKTNVTTLTIPQTTPELTSNVTGSAAGEDVTVTINVGENATGKVIITIDDVPHVVDVDENGTASFTVPNAQPGNHTVTAEYLGDGNYTATGVIPLDDFTVGLFDVEIENITVDLNPDNSANITVKFNESDVGGTVTITDGNQTVTVPVKDGIATANLESLGFNKTSDIKVTFNADDKRYNATSKTESVVLPLLTNATIEVDIKEGQHGDNTTITIKVPVDADGNVTVYVNGTPISVTPDENGTVVLNVTPGVGPNEIKVTLTNSSKYDDIEVTENITIESQDNYTVDIEVTPGQYGENTTITVKVPGELNETVKVIIDGVEYPIEVDENGTGVLNISTLPAGNHTITVSAGNENYTDKTNTTSFSIDQTKPEITVEVDPIDVGETAKVTVTVPEDATGNVVINVDGTEYYGKVTDGKAVIEIPNLTSGTHDLNITYSGDENYTAVNNITPLTVFKVEKPITGETTDITLGDNTVVKVTVPDDATGTVTVKIGDITKTVGVTGGENEIIIPGVPVGQHTVEITYNGDGKYASESTTADLKVSPVETSSDDIKVEDDGNGTVTVTVPENATGNITIVIDGEPYTAEIVNGSAIFNLTNLTDAAPGVHNITVKYSGDENNTAIEYNTTAVIPKLTSSVSAEAPTIREGDDAVINIDTGRSDANGLALVTIDGVGYYANVTDGIAQVIVPGLKEGEYEAIVTYIGDNNYTESSTTAKITVEAPITVDIGGTGNSSTIVIDLPENGTDNVTVLIDGKEYPVVVENGTATVKLDNVTPGNHNVTVIYTDADGGKSVVTDILNVPKWDSSVEIKGVNIRQGDVETFTITVSPDKATGMVHVDIDGTGYYANLTNGKATVNVENLEKGTYTVKVTYLGDENYTESVNTTTIKVDDPITIDVAGVGDDSNIVIDVPENTTGNITVLIDGKEYAAVVDANGTVTIPLENITPGEHNVTVIYTDSDGVTSTVESAITVPKWDTGIKADAPTIREGDNATVTVTIDAKDATGTVLIDVDGIGYYANITNGKATAVIPNLKEGKYTVAVTYPGDDKYNEIANTTELIVEKGITVNLNTDGNDANIAINLPENGTDNVTVEIDGKQYPVTVENGTAKVDISNLEPGIHNVTVTYTDKEGTKSVVEDTINVPKKQPDVGITFTPNDKGGIIDVTVPKDATGPVLINVDGVGYYVTPENGLAKLKLDNLGEGLHNITVDFLGDNKYNETSKTTAVKINKELIGTILEVDPTLTRVANDYYNAGEEGDYFYGVLKDTKGNLLSGKTIQIAVNGAYYNVTTDSQGRAGLKINLVSANVYTYALFFQGDDDYDAAKLVSTRLTVTKKPTTLTASNVAFKASSKTKTIKVTLGTSKNPYDGKTYLSSKKVIKLTIKGKTYTAKTNKNGVAKFTIKLTKKGTYTAKIKFKGTKTYAASSKKIKVTIK